MCATRRARRTRREMQISARECYMQDSRLTGQPSIFPVGARRCVMDLFLFSAARLVLGDFWNEGIVLLRGLLLHSRRTGDKNEDSRVYWIVYLI